MCYHAEFGRYTSKGMYVSRCTRKLGRVRASPLGRTACLTPNLIKVEARITYKLCLLMYRVVRRTAPVYLAELCQPCTDPRRRSTAAREDFEIPRNNRRFTNSSFSIATSTAWNKLPTHIRTSTTLSSFPSRLKTHLYTTSFAIP